MVDHAWPEVSLGLKDTYTRTHTLLTEWMNIITTTRIKNKITAQNKESNGKTKERRRKREREKWREGVKKRGASWIGKKWHSILAEDKLKIEKKARDGKKHKS